jgi:hypothetical protein
MSDEAYKSRHGSSFVKKEKDTYTPPYRVAPRGGRRSSCARLTKEEEKEISRS